MKTISVEVSAEFDRQLRIRAAQLDMNRSELIRKILEEQSVEWSGQLVSSQVTVTHHLPAGQTFNAIKETT